MEVLHDCPSDLFNLNFPDYQYGQCAADMWSLLVASGHTHCQRKWNSCHMYSIIDRREKMKYLSHVSSVQEKKWNICYMYSIICTREKVKYLQHVFYHLYRNESEISVTCIISSVQERKWNICHMYYIICTIEKVKYLYDAFYYL